MADLLSALKGTHMWSMPPLVGLVVLSLLLVSGVHANSTTGQQMTGGVASYVLIATIITFAKDVFQTRWISRYGCPEKRLDPKNLLPTCYVLLFAGLHVAAVVGLIGYWFWRDVV